MASNTGSAKNRGLGKGLGALIVGLEEENQKPEATINSRLIEINPFQPRKEFSDEKLAELAESIKQHGIIQPLLVRKYNEKYQLIAGERRLRASKLAGLQEVPIVVKNLSDQEMMEVALVENLQRENLNPIEEAVAFKRLMDEFNFTQEEVAKKVGRSRPAIANTLRLLNLPSEVQSDLAQGTLTMGHARALLSLDTAKQQKDAWSKIQINGLSVRDTEEMVKKLNDPKNVSRETPNSKKAPLAAEKDPNLTEIENEFQEFLGTKVNVKNTGAGGKIEIEYYSAEEFERICEKILKY